MKPVPILHIISELPVGGVENQLSLVMRNYDRSIFSPFVCSLTDKGVIGEELENAGIEVFCLRKLGHRFDPTIVRDLYRLIREKQIAVVRTHQYHANLYGRLAARLAQVPCVISSVHNVYTRDRKPHRRLINHFLARFTDRVVAVSETVKRDILRYDRIPEAKIAVIYNGIETSRFAEAGGDAVRAEFGIPHGCPVIGTVGRLTLQKGQIHLLEAVSMLRDRFPHLFALVVGDGPLLDDLRICAHRMNIQERVIFTGARRDVPALLAAMDIFVFPSLWEGLPGALLEAMASGKPVVATDIPPVREVIPAEQSGLLVPPKDSAAIAGSIERFLGSRERMEELGAASRDRATSFSITATVARYADLVDNILRSKGERARGGQEKGVHAQ